MTNHRTLLLSGMGLALAVRAACAAGPAAPGRVLVFPEAWRRVEERSPLLKAASLEAEAAGDLRRQAAARPNPSLDAEIEDFGGTGSRSGVGASETTLSLRQTVEPGARRGGRIAVAAAGHETALFERDERRLDLWRETACAYLEAFVAEERERLAREDARIAAEVAELVGRKAGAGKATPLEARRAGVESVLAEQTAARAAREAQSARRLLAALWKEAEPDFPGVEPLPLPSGDPPAAEELERRLAGAPAMRRAELAVVRREADLRQARAGRLPDLEFAAGVRHAAETDEPSFVAGVSVGLPVFGRQRPAAESAARLLAAAGEDKSAAAARLRAGALGLAATAGAALEEARALDGNALPAAKDNYEAARFGFEQGKFRHLELLDAERSLVEVRRRRIEAVAAAHAALVDLARLLGEPGLFPGAKETDR